MSVQGEAVDGLSDVMLLVDALVDAVEAHGAGVLGGPGVDEVAFRRAFGRAQRADAAHVLRSNALLGGLPRQGKTAASRALLVDVPSGDAA